MHLVCFPSGTGDLYSFCLNLHARSSSSRTSYERNFSSSIISAGLSLDRLHLLSRRLCSSLFTIKYKSSRDNCIIYSFICKLIAVLAMTTLFINTDSQTHTFLPTRHCNYSTARCTNFFSKPAHGREIAITLTERMLIDKRIRFIASRHAS